MIGRRKRREGVVISDKLPPTVVVEVERRVRHARYHKFLRLRRRYHAHDEANNCRIGDRVRLIETRPLSATKRWAVETIRERPEGAAEQIEVAE